MSSKTDYDLGVEFCMKYEKTPYDSERIFLNSEHYVGYEKDKDPRRYWWYNQISKACHVPSNIKDRNSKPYYLPNEVLPWPENAKGFQTKEEAITWLGSSIRRVKKLLDV